MNEIEQKAVRKDGDVTMCDLLDKEIQELTNKKQIEEMAKALDECVSYDEWSAREYGEYTVDCDYTAHKMFEQGYRNCKDKVVLDKEEYEELRQERSDYITELQETHNENCRLRIELEDIRKETARDILNEFGKCKYEKEWYAVWVKLIKKYGIEVE